MKRYHRNIQSKQMRRRLKARRSLKVQVRLLRKQIASLKAAPQVGPAIRINPTALQTPSAAMIYSSELRAIQKHVLRYPDLETGGSLYGWYSETGQPIIAFATGPGENAKHEFARFHADEHYSMAIGLKMIDHGLQHIGEWHSHHILRSFQPSSIDCRAMQASVIGSPTGRFLCGIANIVEGNVTFNLYHFRIGTGPDYSYTPMVLRDGESPVRIGLNDMIGSLEQEGAFL